MDNIQQNIFNDGLSDVLYSRELDVQINLQQALAYEEAFRKDKSRIKWFLSGDRNTTFFFKTSKIRNVTKKVSVFKLVDSVLSSNAEIECHILSFYTDLYASNNDCYDNGLVSQVIPPLVDALDNIMLTSLPTMEEVKAAVFSMDGNSSPGPDGFGGGFYHSFWDIVVFDVFNSCLQFFTQGSKFKHHCLNSKV